MELYRGLHNTPKMVDGCVATIGNFDGVHLGHQKMISALKHNADRLGLPAIVIVFEPQPLEYFLQKKAPARLCRLRDKVYFLASQKIDAILSLPFNHHLANLSPQNFVETVLFQHLKVKHLIVGEDFQFGKNRQGNFPLLKRLGEENNCVVDALPTVSQGNERISSTRIRQVLEQGDLGCVEQLLGRPFSMFGRVAHGDKRARQWGIPTANIYLHRLVSPLQGVYCINAVIDGEIHEGVANVGTRPTVDGTKSLLEVHLLNFNRDIYAKNIEVRFMHKLRDEQRFDNVEALKQQILADVANCAAFFQSHFHCVE